MNRNVLVTRRSPRVGRCGSARPCGRFRAKRLGQPAGHVCEGCRADLPALLRDLSSARRNRADVADDLRRRPAMGALRSNARVAAREMPPWHIDRHIGIQKFKDDPSLTDEEIATIVKWVDGGAPRATRPTCRRRGSSPMLGVADWQAGPGDSVSCPPRAGRRPRPVRFHVARFTPDRGPIHQGDPDAARRRWLAQGHPPRAVVLGGPRGQVPERW